MKFLPEDKADKIMQEFEESLTTDPTIDSSQYTSTAINWVDNLKNWNDCKDVAKNMMGELKDEQGRFIFLAHNKDTIEGKPQLVHQTIKNVTLLRRIFKIIRKEGEETKYLTLFKFLDETFDKRYDGNLTATWGRDFWVYRVIHKGKEYYVLTEKELPLQTVRLTGTTMNLQDSAEMSKTMKLKGFTTIFIAKDFEPTAKILEPKELIELVKEKGIDEKTWTNILDYHELGSYNRFLKETNLLRSAHLLSGKIDGYPLHLAVMGPAGSRKSMGYIETIQQKFGEEYNIVEGANSRIKGLSPSFKEKPANIGYLARAERMGWIDELGKMVEFEAMKHQTQITNVLGELNFLLDHKRRTVGSGNDNECTVQTTAKFLFATNPVKGKRNLQEHVGLIDPTTMSRIFWWVQGDDELNFVLGNGGIERIKKEEIPPTLTLPQELKAEVSYSPTHVLYYGVSVGGDFTRDNFITIFDSTNNFTCLMDEERAEQITKDIENLAKEPMKSVWKPRGRHHVMLLIDGIIKHRCLFIDKDSSFKVKEEDYKNALMILIKMVNNWDADLSIKKDSYNGTGGL